MDLGVTIINREMLLSSLDTARRLLRVLGLPEHEASRVVETFKENDERRLLEHYGLHHDEEKMIAAAKAWTKELEEIFEQDVAAERVTKPAA